MSEENTQQIKADSNSVKNDSTKAEQNETPKTVPYSRVQELSHQNNALKDQLTKSNDKIATWEQEKEKQREEQLKQNNQHEVLIKELQEKNTAYQKKDEYWSGFETNLRNEYLERLPEEKRELADEIKDTLKLRKFVELESKTSNTLKTDSSRPGQGKTGEFGGYGSHAEWAEKDPKGYEAAHNTVQTGVPIAYGIKR